MEFKSTLGHARQQFLQGLHQLGIETISEDNRVFHNPSDEYFTYKLPRSEKSQVFSNLLSLFKIHKDAKAEPVVNKKKLTRGWYLIWPEGVKKGTSLQTLEEESIAIGETWYYGSPPTILYYYDRSLMILLNPYLEELDLIRLQNKMNQKVFFNPYYRLSYLKDYTYPCAFYLGRNLFGGSVKTLNYPQLTLSRM